MWGKILMENLEKPTTNLFSMFKLLNYANENCDKCGFYFYFFLFTRIPHKLLTYGFLIISVWNYLYFHGVSRWCRFNDGKINYHQRIIIIKGSIAMKSIAFLQKNHFRFWDLIKCLFLGQERTLNVFRW